MPEQTEGTIEIQSSPAEIMGVLTDFATYPEWAGVKVADVKTKDSKGRPSEVAFEVSQMGVGAKYTLSYTYAAGDGGMSWVSTEASGAVKDLKGEYTLEEGAGGNTKVTYRTAIETAIPLMGFMKRQAERIIIDTALGGLKKRVEGG